MFISAYPKRYSVVGLSFLAAFICYIDRVNISVAIIPMQQSFAWSETTKGLILSSFYIGYMLFQIPSGWLSNSLGGKLLLGTAVVWWSLMTMLTPAAATLSVGVLILTRIAMGMGEAATFPAAYKMFSQWVPAAERSRAVTLMVSGIPLGTLFALITTGWFVNQFGWPSVFYVFGSIGLIWFIFWHKFIVEKPETHPNISQAELQQIHSSCEVSDTSASAIPWRNILRSGPVWALIINHFCSSWGFYVLLSWLPSYFLSVHNLSIAQAGFYSAAPWLALFLVSNLAAWLADTAIAKGIDTTLVRKAMQSIGLLGSAVFFYLLQGTDSAEQAVLLLCCATGLLAFTWAGYLPNHLDIAPQYAGVLMGMSNTAGTLPGIIGVLITGWLIDMTNSYASAFNLAAAVSVLGAVIWLIAASGKRIQL